MKTKMDGNLIN